MSQTVSGSGPTVDVEQVMARETGSAGLSRYQVRGVVLCVVASMLSALSTNEYVFTTGRIQTRCLIPGCENSAMQPEFFPSWIGNAVPEVDSGFDNCRRFANITSNINDDTNDTCPSTLFDQNTIINCEKYVYENTNTAVYTLGLACNEWLRSFLGSARTFGALLSLPISGFISDRWGRRTALVLCTFNTACIGILRVFAKTYIGFFASVFAEATLGAGAILACCYILGVETVPVKYRVMTGVTINSFSSLAQMILGLLAWALPNWKHLTLVLYVPQLLTLSYIWIVPESLRWYLSKGRYAEAESALKQMAKINKNELSEKTLLELKQATEYKQAKTAENNDRKGPGIIVLLFQYKPVLLRVLTAPVCWITTMLIYYGLGINSVNISGNKYINFVVVAMVDIPGFWTAVFLLDRIGRKPVIIIGYWICGACQIAYIFMPTGYYAASLTVYLIGKFTIAMVGTSNYTYMSELYPTQYRHRLFGYTSMMGRIGSIAAPLTPALGTMVWAELPFALFAGMALVSGLLVMLFPETRGCRLPDTMQEAADLGKTTRTHKPDTTSGHDNPTCNLEE